MEVEAVVAVAARHLRQVRVLQAVYGEAAARVGVARLEVGDDGVVDVLLLLAEEMGADGVERVGRQLVVALEHLEHVELHAALDVDLLRLARPHLCSSEGV